MISINKKETQERAIILNRVGGVGRAEYKFVPPLGALERVDLIFGQGTHGVFHANLTLAELQELKELVNAAINQFIADLPDDLDVPF